MSLELKRRVSRWLACRLRALLAWPWVLCRASALIEEVALRERVADMFSEPRPPRPRRQTARLLLWVLDNSTPTTAPARPAALPGQPPAHGSGPAGSAPSSAGPRSPGPDGSTGGGLLMLRGRTAWASTAAVCAVSAYMCRRSAPGGMSGKASTTNAEPVCVVSVMEVGDGE